MFGSTLALDKLTHVSSPFDVGFEGIGSVVAVGSEVTNQKVGNFVVYTLFGSFSEYVQVPAETAIPVPVSKLDLFTAQVLIINLNP